MRVKYWMSPLFLGLSMGLMMGLTGCASSGGSEDAIAGADANEEDTEIVCRRERKLGSNFKETVCKTRRQLQAETEASQREMDRQRNTQHGKTVTGPKGN